MRWHASHALASWFSWNWSTVWRWGNLSGGDWYDVNRIIAKWCVCCKKNILWLRKHEKSINSPFLQTWSVTDATDTCQLTSTRQRGTPRLVYKFAPMLHRPGSRAIPTPPRCSWIRLTRMSRRKCRQKRNPKFRSFSFFHSVMPVSCTRIRKERNINWALILATKSGLNKMDHSKFHKENQA